MKIGKYHSILLIFLLIIIGNIIYLYPKLYYSSIPTQWGVDSGWGRNYLIKNGQIPENQYALTWQSAIKNYATVDVLPKILAAIINIITGPRDFLKNEKFHHIFPWCGILFLPVVVLSWYEYLSNEERTFNYLDYCLLYLFSIFPLSSTIISMSLSAAAANSVARVVFILILILLLIIFSKQKKDIRILGIFIFFLFPFFYFHHTWSYYLAIHLTAIGFFTVLKKNERYITSLTCLGIILFITSALYYNSILLSLPLQI